MVVAPAATGVAIPLLRLAVVIVAILVLDELQVTLLVIFCTPSE